tara:strand:- start:6946 stop:7893 length:948 start_codon:yes stop_codon:yes gene_type:complete
MNRKAIIFGIKGLNLTSNERKIIRYGKPWGIILFSRNIKDIHQLKRLIKSIKKIVKDKNYPILIDQEGGRVSRLNEIFDFSNFSQRFFEKTYKKNINVFYNIYKIYVDNVCDILNEVGININTIPVLDVLNNYTHKVIGDRSFSSDPSLISKIGNHTIKLYNSRKIGSVMKHIPGHGRATADSHFKLPIITSSKKDLIKKDFRPFKLSNSFFAMTAHIIFKSYDTKYSATHSKIIINDVIRKHIGFKGIIISDDISMKALKYGAIENARLALKAGCNLILHCNGNINEMNKLMKVIPKIDKFTQKKTSQFYKFLR